MKTQANSSFIARLSQMGGLGLAYFGVGKLALMLAIPPGYATAVWPAAGIALAGILLFGLGVWPGILIGSFLVNIWIFFTASHPAAIFSSLSLSIGLAVGATLQAMAGAYLIQRLVGFPKLLDRIQNIFKMMVLGGPVSCVVGATISVTGLLLADVIPSNTYLLNWWTWWLGDTAGVLLLIPLVAMWRMKLGQAQRRTRFFAALVLCLAVVLSVVVYLSLIHI